ncbi:hypothetical protein GPECTOR_4g556 [Gonium pectorale]|uniref:Uncharacterized protein n=1 Tax=Gonium pectorale TaxID=33097 RepID=A0A150GXE0_GONPE|nr:hypothetical protein GPECTOR_4g556 [Gonium pectorale]|eukprot:KXZ54491.1 hypothetical protein GPECTOR_4g556 [Gonium pectorale]
MASGCAGGAQSPVPRADAPPPPASASQQCTAAAAAGPAPQQQQEQVAASKCQPPPPPPTAEQSLQQLLQHLQPQIRAAPVQPASASGFGRPQVAQAQMAASIAPVARPKPAPVPQAATSTVGEDKQATLCEISPFASFQRRQTRRHAASRSRFDCDFEYGSRRQSRRTPDSDDSSGSPRARVHHPLHSSMYGREQYGKEQPFADGGAHLPQSPRSATPQPRSRLIHQQAPPPAPVEAVEAPGLGPRPLPHRGSARQLLSNGRASGGAEEGTPTNEEGTPTQCNVPASASETAMATRAGTPECPEFWRMRSPRRNESAPQLAPSCALEPSLQPPAAPPAPAASASLSGALPAPIAASTAYPPSKAGPSSKTLELGFPRNTNTNGSADIESKKAVCGSPVKVHDNSLYGSPDDSDTEADLQDMPLRLRSTSTYTAAGAAGVGEGDDDSGASGSSRPSPAGADPASSSTGTQPVVVSPDASRTSSLSPSASASPARRSRRRLQPGSAAGPPYSGLLRSGTGRRPTRDRAVLVGFDVRRNQAYDGGGGDAVRAESAGTNADSAASSTNATSLSITAAGPHVFTFAAFAAGAVASVSAAATAAAAAANTAAAAATTAAAAAATASAAASAAVAASSAAASSPPPAITVLLQPTIQLPPLFASQAPTAQTATTTAGASTVTTREAPPPPAATRLSADGCGLRGVGGSGPLRSLHRDCTVPCSASADGFSQRESILSRRARAAAAASGNGAAVPSLAALQLEQALHLGIVVPESDSSAGSGCSLGTTGGRFCRGQAHGQGYGQRHATSILSQNLHLREGIVKRRRATSSDGSRSRSRGGSPASTATGSGRSSASGSGTGGSVVSGASARSRRCSCPICQSRARGLSAIASGDSGLSGDATNAGTAVAAAAAAAGLGPTRQLRNSQSVSMGHCAAARRSGPGALHLAALRCPSRLARVDTCARPRSSAGQQQDQQQQDQQQQDQQQHGQEPGAPFTTIRCSWSGWGSAAAGLDSAAAAVAEAPPTPPKASAAESSPRAALGRSRNRALGLSSSQSSASGGAGGGASDGSNPGGSGNSGSGVTGSDAAVEVEALAAPAHWLLGDQPGSPVAAAARIDIWANEAWLYASVNAALDAAPATAASSSSSSDDFNRPDLMSVPSFSPAPPLLRELPQGPAGPSSSSSNPEQQRPDNQAEEEQPDEPDDGAATTDDDAQAPPSLCAWETAAPTRAPMSPALPRVAMLARNGSSGGAAAGDRLNALRRSAPQLRPWLIASSSASRSFRAASNPLLSPSASTATLLSAQSSASSLRAGRRAAAGGSEGGAGGGADFMRHTAASIAKMRSPRRQEAAMMVPNAPR